jgi:hypothetical protein
MVGIAHESLADGRNEADFASSRYDAVRDSVSVTKGLLEDADSLPMR